MTPPTWLDAHGRRPDARLLDLWPRGRADAVPGRGSPAAWLALRPDPPDPGLVQGSGRVGAAPMMSGTL
jgi:hypothetical protein